MSENILHVLCSFEEKDGGPVRAVLDLCARSLRNGQECEILSFGPDRVNDNPFPLDKVHLLPAWPWFPYQYVPTLSSWLETELSKYSAVVLHGMWLYPLWKVAQACMRQQVRYACFPHGMLDLWPVRGQGYFKRAKKTLYWHLREKSTFHHAHKTFFTTPRELDRAGQTFGFPGHNCLLIPYGIAEPKEMVTEPDTVSLRQPEHSKSALFLGRLHPKKNPDLLIRAWAKAKPAKEWHLVLAGTGTVDYVAQLRSLVSRMNLDSSVHFAGHVSGRDKLYLLQRASWFLLPSDQENFGIAVLEAVANHCAVAISNEVYLSDFFHEESEILPVDEAAWIDFIQNRMPDEQWRKHLLDLDASFVAPRFEIEQVASAWITTLRNAFA